MKTKIPFKKGDLVKGVPGRLSHDWHGTVEQVDTSHANVLIHVHWTERENYPEGEDNWQRIRKQPVTCFQVDWLMFQDGRTITWDPSGHVHVQPPTNTEGQMSIGDEPKPAERESIRLIVAGCRWFQDYQLLSGVLDQLLSKKIGVAEIQIVSGLANGADTLGERYAKEKGYSVKQFKADWETHGKSAGPVRNEEMAAYATHCVCFWDGTSAGTNDMIQRANAHGLKIRVITIEKRSQEDSATATETAHLTTEKRSHTCHAIGCDVEVAPKFLMCPDHWRKVPKPLQDEVYKHYRPGQEIDKQPNAEWSKAARAAIDSVAAIAGPEQQSLLQSAVPVAPQPVKLEMPITVDHAVTLHRPWPFAVTDLGKDVENRRYAPDGIKTGDWIALHAGKAWDQNAIAWVRDLGIDIPPGVDHPTGVVAIFEYLGHFTEGDRGMKSSSWLIGEPLVDSPWFTGIDRNDYGWKIGRVIPLKSAIACGGQRNIWALPPEVKAAIEAEINGSQSHSPPADIEVVNVKRNPAVLNEPDCVYVGRQMTYRGHFIHESPLKNPHRVGVAGTPAEVCEKFERINLSPSLASGVGAVYEEIERLTSLYREGRLKKVACWCTEPGKDNPCHGHSIVKAIKNRA